MRMKFDGRRVFFAQIGPDESFFNPKRWPRIPSQVYPLNGFAEVWSRHNTTDCADQKMLEVFDSIKPEIGCCYQNTENLMNAAKAAGIPEGDLVPHAGWTFCQGDPAPVHHCFAVYKRTAVFDFGAAIKSEWTPLLAGKSREECPRDPPCRRRILRRHHAPCRAGSGSHRQGARCRPPAVQRSRRRKQSVTKPYTSQKSPDTLGDFFVCLLRVICTPLKLLPVGFVVRLLCSCQNSLLLTVDHTVETAQGCKWCKLHRSVIIHCCDLLPFCCALLRWSAQNNSYP